jgi:hypothetical protein
MEAVIKASIDQGSQFSCVLTGITEAQVHQLLGNEDILDLLLDSNLDEVDRKALKEVLHYDPLDRFSHKLVLAADWLNCLRRYNMIYWDGRLTDEQFAQAQAQLTDIPCGHEQHIRGAFFFHVQFDSFEETVKMWMKVFEGELSIGTTRSLPKFNAENFRLHHLAETYEPNTISLVYANLVSYWELESGYSINDDIRPQAEATGEKLAQLEVLSFWGVCTDLFMEQNGTDLPYMGMAGTEMMVPGYSPWSYCLYLIWYRDYRGVQLRARWSGGRHRYWAAPVVRRVRN